MGAAQKKTLSKEQYAKTGSDGLGIQNQNCILFYLSQSFYRRRIL